MTAWTLPANALGFDLQPIALVEAIPKLPELNSVLGFFGGRRLVDMKATVNQE